jgi:uncharacterized protein YbjT (DUF2867 family)
MKVLITGASGFIGRRLAASLLAHGDEVVCAGRRSGMHGGCRWVQADFASASVPAWSELLQGVEVVVNLVGLFREQGAQTFQALHVDGPAALFDACRAAGVSRVEQVSALGAHEAAGTAFLRSKAAADRHLLSLGLDASVVQPSLVFGPDGTSSRQLLRLACLPVLACPAGCPVQPVHVDDVVEGLRWLVHAAHGDWTGRRIAFAGPEPLPLCGYLATLREALGLHPAPTLVVPAWAMAAAAKAGDRWRHALFDSDAWRMLRQGNTATAKDLQALLQHAPRSCRQFIDEGSRPPLALQAQMGWLTGLLRLSLAVVWLLTGFVSVFVFPVGESNALLARAGVPEALRPLALHGAAGLDCAFGVLTLWPLRRLRWLWAAQMLLITAYTAVITLRLPEFWWHPYGPLSKNLPMLAVLVLLWTLAPRKPG